MKPMALSHFEVGELSGTTLFENNVTSYGAAFMYLTIKIVGMISIVNNTAKLGAICIVHSIAVIRANLPSVEILGLILCIVEKLALFL